MLDSYKIILPDEIKRRLTPLFPEKGLQLVLPAYSGKCFHPFRCGVSTCSGVAFPPSERSDASL